MHARMRHRSGGLVPAIPRQHDTGELLMLARMNRAAAAETPATGHARCVSRSGAALWRNGERSGRTRQLRKLRIDCEDDTLPPPVEQPGIACRTGRRSCFVRAVRDGAVVEIAPRIAPEALHWQG